MKNKKLLALALTAGLVLSGANTAEATTDNNVIQDGAANQGTLVIGDDKAADNNQPESVVVNPQEEKTTADQENNKPNDETIVVGGNKDDKIANQENNQPNDETIVVGGNNDEAEGNAADAEASNQGNDSTDGKADNTTESVKENQGVDVVKVSNDKKASDSAAAGKDKKPASKNKDGGANPKTAVTGLGTLVGTMAVSMAGIVASRKRK